MAMLPEKLGLCLSVLERLGDFIYYPILGPIDQSETILFPQDMMQDIYKLH